MVFTEMGWELIKGLVSMVVSGYKGSSFIIRVTNNLANSKAI